MTETIQIWSGEAELYADTRPAPPSIILDICTQLIQTPQPTLIVDLGSGTGLSTVLLTIRVKEKPFVEFQKPGMCRDQQVNPGVEGSALALVKALPHGERCIQATARWSRSWVQTLVKVVRRSA